jgi:hypothetical protein
VPLRACAVPLVSLLMSPSVSVKVIVPVTNSDRPNNLLSPAENDGAAAAVEVVPADTTVPVVGDNEGELPAPAVPQAVAVAITAVVTALTTRPMSVRA